MFDAQRKKNNKSSQGGPEHAFLFYDFETTQELKYADTSQLCTFHNVNLCVAQLWYEKCIDSDMSTRCKFCGGGKNILFKNNCLKIFIDFILDEKNYVEVILNS